MTSKELLKPSASPSPDTSSSFFNGIPISNFLYENVIATASLLKECSEECSEGNAITVDIPSNFSSAFDLCLRHITAFYGTGESIDTDDDTKKIWRPLYEVKDVTLIFRLYELYDFFGMSSQEDSDEDHDYDKYSAMDNLLLFIRYLLISNQWMFSKIQNQLNEMECEAIKLHEPDVKIDVEEYEFIYDFSDYVWLRLKLFLFEYRVIRMCGLTYVNLDSKFEKWLLYKPLCHLDAMTHDFLGKSGSLVTEIVFNVENRNGFTCITTDECKLTYSRGLVYKGGILLTKVGPLKNGIGFETGDDNSSCFLLDSFIDCTKDYNEDHEEEDWLDWCQCHICECDAPECMTKRTTYCVNYDMFDRRQDYYNIQSNSTIDNPRCYFEELCSRDDFTFHNGIHRFESHDCLCFEITEHQCCDVCCNAYRDLTQDVLLEYWSKFDDELSLREMLPHYESLRESWERFPFDQHTFKFKLLTTTEQYHSFLEPSESLIQERNALFENNLLAFKTVLQTK